jgi:hypothetical protein
MPRSTPVPSPEGWPDDPEEQRRRAEALVRWSEQNQKRRHRVFSKLTPLEMHRLKQRLANGTAHISTASAPRRSVGHGGRPRAQASRSSAASGDSPGDDPPPAVRWVGLCFGCCTAGAELQTRWDLGPNRHLCDACAEQERPAQLTFEGVRP